MIPIELVSDPTHKRKAALSNVAFRGDDNYPGSIWYLIFPQVPYSFASTPLRKISAKPSAISFNAPGDASSLNMV